ncbi:hypothetical protein [Rhodocaloribacter sp.]
MNEKPLTTEEAQKLRSYYQDKFDNICAHMNSGQYPELEKLLNPKWKDRVKKWLASIQPGQVTPPRQLHHLINALADGGSPPFHIGVDVLEKRLRVVRDIVRAQGKTKLYRSTLKQLIVDNADQVHASLFEITILYALIGIDPHLELYPTVGTGNNNVEAKISLGQRDIFCECAVRGYSPPLDNRQGAIDPYAAPVKMVEATLLKKMGPNGQLTHVAENHPTVLLTCVGFDIFHSTYITEMKRRITATSCSASIIFERYHCNSFAVVLNSASPNQLQGEEIQIIINGLKQQLKSSLINNIYYT